MIPSFLSLLSLQFLVVLSLSIHFRLLILCIRYPCSFSLYCRSRFTFVSRFFVFAILAVSRCIVALDSLSSLDSLFICVDLCFLLSCGCHQGTFFTRVLLVTCNLVLALLSFRQSAVFFELQFYSALPSFLQLISFFWSCFI